MTSASSYCGNRSVTHLPMPIIHGDPVDWPVSGLSGSGWLGCQLEAVEVLEAFLLCVKPFYLSVFIGPFLFSILS